MSNAARQASTPRIPPSAHEAVALRGALALALINTETLDRGKTRDALSSPDALARWWAAACQRYPDQGVIEGTGAPIAWTSELLEAVHALRRALRTLLTQAVEQQRVEEEDLTPVNVVLALGFSALESTGEGAVKAVMRLRESEQGSVLVPIAHSALQLVTESDWQRLHQCKHDRCIVFFYDTTKSGTRRWCSPGCMNRARSIRHYRLTKNKVAPE